MIIRGLIAKRFICRSAFVLCCFIVSTLLLTACGDNTEEPIPTSAPLKTPTVVTLGGATTAPTTAATTASSSAITVAVNQTKILHPISPYIYGLNYPEMTEAYAKDLRPTFIRWGGNPMTRYNWVLGNAWNASRDWKFQNYGADDPPSQDLFPHSASDSVVKTAKDLGIVTLITIPTIGWVAKNGDRNTFSQNVPDQGGPPARAGSDAIVGYDPTANRNLTSVQSKARKGAPFVFQPDPKSPVIYQDEWVAHLVKEFGNAADGGVKFYAMDNEPELWSEQHTDVHPVKMSYEDLLSQFLEYADAVKAVDPTAEITGPVSHGWNGYMFSELDRGDDNFRTTADRRAHNNMPFLAWFLQEVKKHDDKVGYRTLDVLDIHYYPQAPDVYGDGDSSNVAALRLNSVRSLYDPNYVDESWIAQRVQLIPRMKQWIDQYYPGTKLAISEWNWGSNKTMSGALAIANVLGIFGREDVYAAAFWRYPESDGAGYQAFKLYTNFDGKGTRFGDQAIEAASSAPLTVSSFAAVDSKTNRMQVILINNKPGRDYDVELQLGKNISSQNANVYQLGEKTGNRLIAQEPLPVKGDKIQIKVPEYSVVMLDVQL